MTPTGPVTPTGSVPPTVAIFADLTDTTMGLVDFAVEVEARGFSGLFVNEHTHLPVEHPTSRFPPGGPTPMRYGRFWDPYIALSFVAARTGLQIGTAVSLIGEHDPIQLAHATSTLDHLSGGRLVLGVGWGWNREEFADHGRPAEARARVLEEWVGLLRAVWDNDVASFRGEYASLSPSWCWPKPIQPGGPPVLLGGPGSARNYARIARFADGWVTMGQATDATAMAAELAELRAAWHAAGRAGAPRVSVIHNPRPGGPPLDEVVGVCASLGAERVLHHVYEGDRAAMLRRLDRAAGELSGVRPSLPPAAG